MEMIIEEWLQKFHPHSRYLAHETIGKSKIKIIAEYLDNSNTRHGHGSGEIIKENYYINIWDLL
jgi:hypothetical protein